jgi:uncharacterized OsmC-like protein
VTEKVLIRQNDKFEMGFWAVDPDEQDSEEFQPVAHIHDLTPYGMLLASLGSCTAIVLHTYAQNHGVELEEVEVRLQYERVFKEDCENCDEIERYDEQIEEEIVLSGDLASAEYHKLSHIAHQCSIYKMIDSGMTIKSHLAKDSRST